MSLTKGMYGRRGLTVSGDALGVILIISLAFVALVVISNLIRSAGRMMVQALLKYDPQGAFEQFLKNFAEGKVLANQYPKELTMFADKYFISDAMVKLAQYYSGDPYPDKKDVSKAIYWTKRAAAAGDLDTILSVYGFTEYSFTSDAYDEILAALGECNTDTPEKAEQIKYLRGLVMYKKGDIKDAMKIFAANDSEDLHFKYMLVRCHIKEDEIEQAEQLLEQLEQAGWEIQAVEYQKLFNIYTGAEGADVDYQKSIIYAEKYKDAVNAKPEKAQEQLGIAYNNIAVSYQQGINGFEKNLVMAAENFKKAVNYGVNQSLYPLAMLLLVGESEGMVIPRDYSLANEMLERAAKDGNAAAREMLQKNGVGGVLLTPLSEDDVTYHFMGDNELTLKGVSFHWLYLLHGLGYKACAFAEELKVKYPFIFTNFVELLDCVHLLYAEQIAQMLRWGVKVLMWYGIDEYDEIGIRDQCVDLSLLPRVPAFMHTLEIIQTRAGQMNIELAYLESAFEYWEGPNFDMVVGAALAGALRGKLSGGPLPLGSGLLHDHSDSLNVALNNDELANLHQKIYENPRTMHQFFEAVRSACLDICETLRTIIENHTGMSHPVFEGEIFYAGEPLCEIDDRLLVNRINDNLSMNNDEYVYAMLVENLRREPMNEEIINRLYKLSLRMGATDESQACAVLRQVEGDLGMDVLEKE